MSFPSIVSNDLSHFFRLLDDYDNHGSSYGKKTADSVSAFRPKFDVRESKNAYELYGELCGIEQEDISVEFADPHTIVIKGRVERNPGTQSGRVTGEVKGQDKPYHKPTAEDEIEDTENAGTSTISKTITQSKANVDGVKYWITERSVGEFHRSFSFPSRVDQDAVKASLKNGILSVTIPKAQAHQARRIQIS
ncbi:MAG: hypothetical protein M1839_005567 [Geoglossum umbratile]|nr:MAG: hypothetical protein M1839_005567 [Geoglossum umbratile]